MQKLSESEIFQRIDAGETFECEAQDGSFTLKIEAYTPSICTAIHAGHRFRSSLLALCNLGDGERLYEEDPDTDLFIQAMPITLIASDSRYEYDLNRPLATCIYTKAWGKEVWNKSLSQKERRISIAKHQAFYRVLDALVEKVEKQFGVAQVFDVHSYNHLRRDEITPVFNIGTEQIDLGRWQAVLDNLTGHLAKITLRNMPVDVACDQVFFGRGYMISHINSRFENTLVVPLEIKKVYMDELQGEAYPLVLQTLTAQFKGCLAESSAFFTRRYTSKRRAKKSDMLPEKMDPAILKVDRALFQLAQGLETLHYINPINIQAERKAFFKRLGNYEPKFRYRPLDIDPYHFREQLYRLPVSIIRDPEIQALYRDVIDSFSKKVDLLIKAGHPEFVYQSLQYYGEPSIVDEHNARYLLHASRFSEESPEKLGQEELVELFHQKASAWGMKCKIETSNRLVASAMVSNSRKAVQIAKGLVLPHEEAYALLHHELGVHMATTLNAEKQRLKVFSLGLPGNTLTQEGLAILNEYQSGYMTLKRLKGLALRVLAVKEMLAQGSFRHTTGYLIDEHGLSADGAFKLAVRVHRGGGFTKDYLYLRGVSQALELSRSQDISNLYIGKTGFNYLSTINEMVDRQLVSKPIFLPDFLQHPVENSQVLEYLMRCIRYDPRTRPEPGGENVWSIIA